MTETVFDLQPHDDTAWRELSKYLAQNDTQAMQVTIKPLTDKRRTLPQNAALHKYCELLAQALNDAGMECVRSLQILRQKPDVEIPWTAPMVKDSLWRPVQVALYPEKESTKDLEKQEVSVVYETLNRHTADRLGVSINFPDKWGG